MWNLLNYLFYSSLLLPNSSTVCKGSDTCPIVWNNPINGHIEMQLKHNNTWTSTTSDGKSYFSIIVDSSTTNYDWIVPQYITQTWENPKRVVLANLENSEHYYSDQFTIPGVTLYSGLSSIITSNTQIPLTWKSNDITTFGIYLLYGDDNIDTIEPPLLPSNYTYHWEVPYIPSQEMSIMVRSIDNNTYDISPTFQIATTTTTPTTTLTTTLTTTPTTTLTTTFNTTASVDTIADQLSIWLWVLIITSAVIGMIGILYIIYSICYSEKNRIHPSRNPPALVNPVYDTSSSNIQRQSSFYNNRPLPPLTSSRTVNNDTYHSVNADRYHHLRRDPINQRTNVNYSILNRDTSPHLTTTYRYPPSN